MGIFDNVISGLSALEASIAAINAKPLEAKSEPVTHTFARLVPLKTKSVVRRGVKKAKLTSKTLAAN
ncbi:hypothetical protein [Rhizobium grahamii]|uniref:Uncharacterized protein n=1 Tax=Rhizobium grahamii TaxID=1120045 RepID=A0A370KGN7_9HYPH|nr:hypothetical protein [Rhizobium grahamii]RDJ03797.1 hypothetical protein B5K06_28130 [Rhizobium grahamii]